MEYYYNRDLLQDKFDNEQNKLLVYCEINTVIYNLEIILHDDMNIEYKCSCRKPYCEHMNFLLKFIKNNYISVQHTQYFKIDSKNINTFLSIPISGSKGDLYCVDIKYDHNKHFTYHCSCGLKYTKYNRHKCRHIVNTLDNILFKFIGQKDEYEEGSSLTEAIQDLDIK